MQTIVVDTLLHKRGRWMVLLTLVVTSLGCSSTQPLASEPGLRVEASGRLVDAVSGQPLARATIRVGRTHQHTTSDSTGAFTLPEVPLGSHDVMVVAPAYGTSVQFLIVSEEGIVNDAVFRLPRLPSTDDAAASEEGAADENRQPKRAVPRVFERLYLGSPRFPECTLTNPSTVGFTTEVRGNAEVMRVTANEPLVIENRWLGYRVHVALQGMVMIRRRGGFTMLHENIAAFEDLTPRDDEERKRWRKNRREAYRGSLQHFLAALAVGRAVKEEFRVYAGTSVENTMTLATMSRRTVAIEVDPFQYVSPTVYAFARVLRFPGEWRITFASNVYKEDTDFQGIRMGDQTSWIRLREGLAPFTVRGDLFDSNSLRLAGYWAVRRVCQLLPHGYQPH